MRECTEKERGELMSKLMPGYKPNKDPGTIKGKKLIQTYETLIKESFNSDAPYVIVERMLRSDQDAQSIIDVAATLKRAAIENSYAYITYTADPKILKRLFCEDYCILVVLTIQGLKECVDFRVVEELQRICSRSPNLALCVEFIDQD